jgi:hypothetical protein
MWEAGDGYTARFLTMAQRIVVPIEPATGMIPAGAHPSLGVVQADIERLPFGDEVFDGAYATWAYSSDSRLVPSSTCPMGRVRSLMLSITEAARAWASLGAQRRDRHSSRVLDRRVAAGSARSRRQHV